MNPLDKSWDFLKAPMEGGENKTPLAVRAAERRRKLRAAAAKQKAEGEQPTLQEAIEARNNAARANLQAGAKGPMYPRDPPMSQPSQSPLVSSTGINDPHDPRTMQPKPFLHERSDD